MSAPCLPHTSPSRRAQPARTQAPSVWAIGLRLLTYQVFSSWKKEKIPPTLAHAFRVCPRLSSPIVHHFTSI